VEVRSTLIEEIFVCSARNKGQSRSCIYCTEIWHLGALFAADYQAPDRGISASPLPSDGAMESVASKVDGRRLAWKDANLSRQ